MDNPDQKLYNAIKQYHYLYYFYTDNALQNNLIISERTDFKLDGVALSHINTQIAAKTNNQINNLLVKLPKNINRIMITIFSLNDLIWKYNVVERGEHLFNKSFVKMMCIVAPLNYIETSQYSHVEIPFSNNYYFGLIDFKQFMTVSLDLIMRNVDIMKLTNIELNAPQININTQFYINKNHLHKISVKLGLTGVVYPEMPPNIKKINIITTFFFYIRYQKYIMISGLYM